jgi:hypothetical protein
MNQFQIDSLLRVSTEDLYNVHTVISHVYSAIFEM